MNFILGYFKYIFFIFLIFNISCKPSTNPNQQDPETVISTEEDAHDEESLYFEEGYSVLSQKGNKLFIDESGNSPEELSSQRIKENVGSEISSMDHFHNGFAIVMIKEEQGGLKWAYINKKGKNAFGESFSYAGEFEDNHAIVKKDNSWGIIDNKGNYLVEAQYDGISAIIHNNLWIKKGEKWQYVSYPEMTPVLDGFYQIFGKDYEGTFWVDKMNLENNKVLRAYATKEGKIISPWFSNATDFSEGLAAFEEDKKWGFIDKDGNIIIEPKFGYTSKFSEGLAPFTTINKDGFGNWGYIDKTGEVVIPMKYQFATDFKNGFAEVRDKNGRRGFIGKDGNIVIDYLYDLSYNFYEGLAAVKKDNKWGFIDNKGNIVIDFKFDNVLSFHDNPFDGGFSQGYAKVEVDGYEFFIGKSGKCVMGCLE